MHQRDSNGICCVLVYDRSEFKETQVKKAGLDCGNDMVFKGQIRVYDEAKISNILRHWNMYVHLPL